MLYTRNYLSAEEQLMELPMEDMVAMNPATNTSIRAPSVASNSVIGYNRPSKPPSIIGSDTGYRKPTTNGYSVS